jgi:hypothetical protein
MAHSKNIHVAPENIEDVYDNIHFDEALSSSDERYVETAPGRGDDYFRELAGFFNVNLDASKFRGNPPKNTHAMLCGHRGCGKSTELNRFRDRLDQKDLFFVVQIDTFRELNPNDVQFVDIFMALAQNLFHELRKKNIEIKKIYIKNLEKWLFEKVVSQNVAREWGVDIKSGVEGRAHIPLFLKVFASITSSFKNSATYNNSLRRRIQNSFGEFAMAFNQLAASVADQLPKKAGRRSLLFLVDGLDKLSNDDFDLIFLQKTGQLRQIKSNFLYAAPIDLLYSDNQMQQDFEATVLPMIKLFEKNGDTFKPGWEVLRNMIYKRAHPALFDPDVADRVVEFSGGNPRHLIQLLKYLYVRAEDRFKQKDFDYSIKRFATNYERFLTMEDYGVLFRQDQNPQDTTPSEEKRRLLHNLALLQYNSFWWKSHPAVRTLPVYQNMDRKSHAP